MDVLRKRKAFVKKLYFNAGKSIMDDCFVYMKKYINYSKLNSIYFCIKNCCSLDKITLEDCCGAFFTTLCERLINETFYNELSVIILDSHYNEKVICQLHIPDKNLVIDNTFSSPTHCKANTLYTYTYYEKSKQSQLIAYDFFKKAYKKY